MIYIFIILILVFLSYSYDYKEVKNGKTFWIFLIAFIFIAIGTLHYRVGIDTLDYERFYDNLRPLSNLKESEITSSRYAPGFIILASFTKIFSPDLVLLNFLYSSFVCGVVVWFLNKYTKHIFFALLMFFIFCYTLLIFEQIREAIAVGIFLLSFNFFVKKQWIYWYGMAFLAVMFHTSSIMMFVLPIILLPGIKQLFIFGKRTFIISVLVLALAFYFEITFSKYIDLLAMTPAMEEMTKHYANTTFVEGNLNILGIISKFIQYIIYPLFAMICLSQNSNKEEKSASFNLIESFTIISIYISILSIGVPIISRYNNYFLFFPIVIIGDWIFSNIKIGNKIVRFGFVYWVLILLPMFLFQLTSYNLSIDRNGKYKNYMYYYPLTTYIDKEKDYNKERAFNMAHKRMRRHQ